MGNPTYRVKINYRKARGTTTEECHWVTEKGGFPSFGIVKYEVCETVRHCRTPRFKATITYYTFGPNHISEETVVGKESGDWVYFDIDDTDKLRFWVRQRSAADEVDLVLEKDRGSRNYTWHVLEKS